MQKIKIVGIFDKIFLPIGGSELTIIELFSKLSKEGFQTEIFSYSGTKFIQYVIDTLNILELPYSFFENKICYVTEGISITIFIENDPMNVPRNFLSVIENRKPDIVFGLFCEMSLIVISNVYPGLPVILYVHTFEFIRPNKTTSVIKKFIMNNNNIIAPSEFMQNCIYREWGVKPAIFKDYIEKDKYLSENRESKFITMINPNVLKGRDIFIEIASKLPEKQFLSVGGWYSNNYREFFQNNVYNRFSNIIYEESTNNMKSIYSKTSVLLFPSLCEETFGRVIIESFLNGIPVLATKVGALRETLSGAGFLFEINKIRDGVFAPDSDFSNWVETLRKLEDPVFYNEVSVKCRKVAEKYFSDLHKSMENLKKYLYSLK